MVQRRALQRAVMVAEWFGMCGPLCASLAPGIGYGTFTCGSGLFFREGLIVWKDTLCADNHR
jgi:hypothetical protein